MIKFSKEEGEGIKMLTLRNLKELKAALLRQGEIIRYETILALNGMYKGSIERCDVSGRYKLI